MCDVDHFKRVNDVHGHAGGDRVLVEVGRRLLTGVRTYDSIGRYGGEEFLVVLPEADLTQAVDVAERLRAGVAAGFIRGIKENIVMTASFGVVTREAGSPGDCDALIQMADTALYQAKNSGRNRVKRASNLACADPVAAVPSSIAD